eukprot:gene25444-11104_t
MNTLQILGPAASLAAAHALADALGGAMPPTQESIDSCIAKMTPQHLFGMLAQMKLFVEEDEEIIKSCIAKMTFQHLFSALSQMKLFVEQDEEAAREILATNPLLTRAMFQVQIALGLVNGPATIGGGPPGGPQPWELPAPPQFPQGPMLANQPPPQQQQQQPQQPPGGWAGVNGPGPGYGGPGVRPPMSLPVPNGEPSYGQQSFPVGGPGPGPPFGQGPPLQHAPPPMNSSSPMQPMVHYSNPLPLEPPPQLRPPSNFNYQQHQGGLAPPQQSPPQPSVPPQPAAQASLSGDQQQQLLKQLLSLTPEQVEALPPTERAQAQAPQVRMLLEIMNKSSRSGGAEEDYTGSKIECYGFDEGRSYIGDALLLNRVASGGLGQVYLAQFKTGSSAGSFSALKAELAAPMVEDPQGGPLL